MRALYQVNYTKRFVSGLLEGLTHNDVVRFPDFRSAKQFARYMHSGVITPCAGVSEYTCEDVTVEHIEVQS